MATTKKPIKLKMKPKKQVKKSTDFTKEQETKILLSASRKIIFDHLSREAASKQPRPKTSKEKANTEASFVFNEELQELSLSESLHNKVSDLINRYTKPEDCIINYDNLKSRLSHYPDRFKDFSTYLDAEKLRIEQGYAERTQRGTILFNDLSLYYKIGADVIVDDDIEDLEPVGGTVTRVVNRAGWFPSVEIQFECITSANGAVKKTRKVKNIYKYSGVRKIASLPVRPISEEEKLKFTERGKLFRDIVSSPTYLTCEGNLLTRTWYGYMRFKSTGRVMIDARAMKQVRPNYDTRVGNLYNDEGDEENTDLNSIPDDDLWRTESRVFGFSFSLKMWGEFRLDSLSNIKYRSDAYKKLVLDEEAKETILALVKTGNKGFTDLIEGKGGGCIFLLHGPPGVGKTMTAEAVAEFLQRPLYSVSAGELGTEPSELEEALRTILDIASTWNAVILLDEADVYLEQRDEKDIIRNAMVGVFLRLLEYHNGVMFLTTNRVKEFDRAFFSRITMVLHYPEMTSGTRLQVWQNLLESAGVTYLPTEDLVSLASRDLNGRQIKNTIRAAQALSPNEPLTEKSLLRVINITTYRADIPD